MRAGAVNIPIGLKMRTSWNDKNLVAHGIIGSVSGLSYVAVHGRSRHQHYRHTADWEYVSNECGKVAHSQQMQFIGNGKFDS